MQEKEKLFDRKDYLFRYNFDMLIVCLALSVMGIYLNGIRAFWQIVICAFSAVLCEFICFKAVVRKNTLGDLSALVTGIVIALMLPASAPFYVGAFACVFAVAVAKLPFGSAKSVPFVPSAAGFCFAAALFPDEVFFYGAEAVTLTDMISSGEGVSLDVFGITALVSGSYAGAVGTTGVLALTGALGFMLIRHRKRLYAPLGFVLTVALIAFIFPRVNSGRISSAVTEVCAGSLLLVALLIMTDPVTTPKNKKSAVIYGALAGVICVLLRFFSKTADPCCFAVLCVNALRPVFFSKKTAVKKYPVKEKVNKRGGAEVEKQSAKT